MKLLLTGILPSSVLDMGARLVRDGHHVAILGQAGAPDGRREAGVALHDMSVNDPDALRLIKAAHYDAIVFFYAFQCENFSEYGSSQGAVLDALFAMQHAARENDVERMILITDRRVFGLSQAGREDETPMPDTQTGMLIKAAEDCLCCGDPGNMRLLITRVTSLYAPGDADSFFTHASRCAATGQALYLDGRADTLCDFLHADDLAVFISAALDARLEGVAHVSYGKALTYGELAAALARALPDLKIEYSGRAVASRQLSGGAARQVDFVPRHNAIKEIDRLAISPEPVKTPGVKRFFARLFKRSRGGVMPWAELVLLCGAAWFMADKAQSEATFRFVDYWLLFVVLMGTLHGALMGALAALLACLGYAYEWVASGQDLYLLLYNVDNWLPLASYFLAGALFGYFRDKSDERIAAAERERAEKDAEARFLMTMYQQAYEDRNQFKEQVMRYRDSYGRIYRITRQLDSMQPEQVFLSTLDVMEDVMQNQSVAIYIRRQDSPFARLMVRSRNAGELPRSLSMDDLPLLKADMDEDKVFTNTSLAPGYPAMASPLKGAGEQSAFIALWDVPFDKQTLYYRNLFSVVTGLVQSALARAFNYIGMVDDMYVAGTHILTDGAFRAALSVYQSMRKQRTGNYLLVRVLADQPLDAVGYDKRVYKVARATDVAGLLDNGDYCVIFPQASAENLPQIKARFAALGITCELVSQEAAYA